VLTSGGAIVSVGGDPAGYPAAAEVLDLRGYLLLPSLTEPHAHLGKAFTGAGFTGAGFTSLGGSLREVPGAETVEE
jgi:imidazolonepropionase-like amidohydrolase